MFEMQALPDVIVVDGDGTPLKDANGVIISVSQRDFMRHRASDEAFCGQRAGIDMALHVFEANVELRSQSPEVGGVWRIEDARMASYRDACRTTRFSPLAMAACLPFFAAVRDAKQLGTKVEA